MPYDVIFSPKGDVLVLTIPCRQLLAADSADAFRQQVLAAILCFQARKVVLDCRQVVYACGEVLRMLKDIQDTLKYSGGRMVLCHLHDRIETMVRWMELIDPDNVRPTREEAVALLMAWRHPPQPGVGQ
jgi:anti-anti-sigma regulatory factor